jgi:hypothetical protein
LRTVSGPVLETPTPAATGTVETEGAPCSIDRLRLTPLPLPEPPATSAPIAPGLSSGDWTPLPELEEVGLNLVVPDDATWRVFPFEVEVAPAGAITIALAITAVATPVTKKVSRRCSMHTPKLSYQAVPIPRRSADCRDAEGRLHLTSRAPEWVIVLRHPDANSSRRPVARTRRCTPP